MAAIKQWQVSYVKVWYAKASCRRALVENYLIFCRAHSGGRIFAELGGSGCNHRNLHADHFTVVAAKTAAFIGGVACDDVTKRE